MPASSDTGAHRRTWDAIYAARETASLGWYQPLPTVSLELIDALRLPPGAAILDAGGGASTLVDALRARGFTDVTVLDVSSAALQVARRRAGEDAAQWVQADLLTWLPDRRYDLWHDRAVFHFLVDAADRARYGVTLRRALRDGGHAIVGTFAHDAPERCSGMPVQRYDAGELLAALGTGFTRVADRREVHRTPGGVVQPYTWVALRYTYAADRPDSGT